MTTPSATTPSARAASATTSARGTSGGDPTTVDRPAAGATTSRVDRIDRAAISTAPAERLDGEIVVTWIGGSELELDGRSLPEAVAERAPTADGRPITIVADTVNAPLPGGVAARVALAAERNVDALVVSLPPSWSTWDGHDACRGITPPHAFYACILEPRPGTDVGALLDEIARLIDTIAAADVPAYVYVQPHSAEALADPLLADRLAEVEQRFAELDPGVDHVEYVPHIVNRGLPPLREGVEFYDMVHPTDAGIQQLADFFAAEIARVIAERASAG